MQNQTLSEGNNYFFFNLSLENEYKFGKINDITKVSIYSFILKLGTIEKAFRIMEEIIFYYFMGSLVLFKMIHA